MTAPLQTIDAHRPDWLAALDRIQAQPLEFLPAFPEIARRWNDWWALKNDRPLLVVTVATDAGRRISWDKGFDCLDRVDDWMALRFNQFKHTLFAGEALPSIRVDLGPVVTGAYLGAPLHFAPAQSTSWQTPIIHSWETDAALGFAPSNEWFVKTLRLIEILAADARGRYLVCLPDLSGAIDVLANLRGSQTLCFDLFENREAVMAAADRVVDAWEHAYAALYDAALSRGAGLTQFVAAWASVPFTAPTCDYNALIGPEDFREVCMPSLREQARRAGLSVIHLDGPEASRHAETLAADPFITAIQYTPGAGTPSALAKLPMFKMIQAHRKPLFIETPFAEVKPLLQGLDPRGVTLRVSGVPGPDEAHALVNWRNREFA
jgi:hypothetical protein